MFCGAAATSEGKSFFAAQKTGSGEDYALVMYPFMYVSRAKLLLHMIWSAYSASRLCLKMPD